MRVCCLPSTGPCLHGIAFLICRCYPSGCGKIPGGAYVACGTRFARMRRKGYGVLRQDLLSFGAGNKPAWLARF